MELEIKNFKAAGEILAKFWLELIINDHPVKATYLVPINNCDPNTLVCLTIGLQP